MRFVFSSIFNLSSAAETFLDLGRAGRSTVNPARHSWLKILPSRYGCKHSREQCTYRVKCPYIFLSAAPRCPTRWTALISQPGIVSKQCLHWADLQLLDRTHWSPHRQHNTLRGRMLPGCNTMLHRRSIKVGSGFGFGLEVKA